MSFLAATGDNGSLSYPAASPNVIAVGATSLVLNGSNQRVSEVAWNNSIGVTGSGTSQYESKPSYQTVNSATSSVLASLSNRGAPDVSWDGDPNTGYYVYLTGTNGSGANGSGFFSGIGGTSIASPQWTGLIALADQTRVTDGLNTLTTTQVLTALYALLGTSNYSKAFYDVTSGSVTNADTNTTYSAGPGYDEVSGLGSPDAAFLVPYLASVPEPSSLLLVSFRITALLARRHRRTACMPL